MYKIRYADEESNQIGLIGPRGAYYDVILMRKISGAVRPCGFKDDILYIKFENKKFIQVISHRKSHRLHALGGDHFVSCDFGCDIERVQGIEVDEKSLEVIYEQWIRVEN